VTDKTAPDAGTAALVRQPTDDAIAEAAARLRAGDLVAFPTETVYGLGGDATNDTAVARIFAAKGRPQFNPLIVHVPDIDAARRLVTFNRFAETLATALWPGPLTLVLQRRADCPVSRLASAGLDTLAVRVPHHPLAQKLLRACGLPLAAPSANTSGRISPTTAVHVAADLANDQKGAVAMILDGGPCAVGLESTVVDLSGRDPALLRPGGVTPDVITGLIGPLKRPAASAADAVLRAPGMLTSHYAPRLPLRLNALDPDPDEALLAFGPDVPEGAAITVNLSPRGDLVEAAASLFALLHDIDDPAYAGIAAMPVPNTGLGIAINDRLRRAAATRE
jgi:L-threonylcarbamoyladenylate synthase